MTLKFRASSPESDYPKCLGQRSHLTAVVADERRSTQCFFRDQVGHASLFKRKLKAVEAGGSG